MTPQTDLDGFDDQDGAEVLDETNLTEDGDDIANFDDIDDVYDITQAEGDEDEEEDEDVDIVDESELDAVEDELGSGRDDEGLDVEREPLDPVAGDDRDVEDGISDDVDGPAAFESEALAEDDIEALGYADES